MDFFAMQNDAVAAGVYWSLCGVGGEDLEAVRTLARQWLELGKDRVGDAGAVAKLRTR
jgi:hypothetical protein